MDLLSDLFRQSGLHRRLLDLRELTPAVGLRFPCDRSIGLHVVLQGEAWVHAPTLAAPLALRAGDIALMARGCTHLVSAGAVPPAEAETVRAADRAPAAGADGPAGHARLVSGAYQLWNPPVHPFFAQLPDWFVLRGEDTSKLGPLALATGLLADELRNQELGADTVVLGLLDAVFAYVLREVVARCGAEGAGWCHAVRDPQVRRAVTAMHDDPARAWTLEELAGVAGLSRTLLAERFRAAMGDTPLNYLRTVRMQVAARLLADTDRTLEQVAEAVGYQDAFGFSKVFKRTIGRSPRAFRQQDAADRQLPWRLAG